MLIAVYGATGYQAGLVLTELSRRGIDAVLVARDARRLHRAASEAGLRGSPRRVADLADHAGLVGAFADCDAVINCAGPFTESGQAVVRAAIDADCHYVDTSGEQLYVNAVFDAFGREAERRAVTVLPAANDGCVPADLAAHLIGERTAAVEEMSISHIIDGGVAPSRGTLRSALRSIDALTSGGLAFDGGTWRSGERRRRTSVRLPGAGEPTEMIRFPLVEVVTVPRHVAVRRLEGLVEAGVGARLGTPLPEENVAALPDGPTEPARRAERFTHLIDAVTADGHRVRATVEGSDTYGTTAVIAVEAARRIVADGPPPGVLAPAQAVDPAGFLGFLSRRGLRWNIGAPVRRDDAARDADAAPTSGCRTGPRTGR